MKTIDKIIKNEYSYSINEIENLFTLDINSEHVSDLALSVLKLCKELNDQINEINNYINNKEITFLKGIDTHCQTHNARSYGIISVLKDIENIISDKNETK